jgi:serine protease Do
MPQKSLLAILLLVLFCTAPVMPAAAQAEPVPGAPDVKVYSYADLVEKLLPAVVNVSATQLVGKEGPQGMTPEEFMQQIPPGSPFEDFFKDFLERHGGGNSPRRTQASLGSGFIIDAAKGIVVTNNHVVADADEVNIILQDDHTIPAKVLGADPKTDLAVLQIPTNKYPLTEVKWGNSDAMRVGDPVLAIGNPFGLGGTVTSGIISARARNINAGPYDDFLQTDAAINRGNSGGPMFNLRGEVIGINTAIFSPTGGSVGIGFAIPEQMAKTVVNQIIQYGQTRRGWIGVRIQQVTNDIAENLGLGKARGALIASTAEPGPAAAADIKPGDIILTFNNKEITEMSKLPRLVAETEIDAEVPVTIWRKGEIVSKVIKIGSLEKAEKAGVLEGRRTEDGEPARQTGAGQALGMTLEDLSPVLRQQYGLSRTAKGVVITQVAPNTDAAEKRLQAGDLLMELNQKPVKSAAEVLELIAAAQRQGRKTALMLVDSKGDLRFIALSLDAVKSDHRADQPKGTEKK